jgi:2-methylisocitrate lyase-like PEP mutase family enzyme
MLWSDSGLDGARVRRSLQEELSMYLSQPCLPEVRRPQLRAALTTGRLLRAIECHSPLSAMLGAAAEGAAGERFDALWASGFANATAMGLPDAELSLLERRLDSIGDIAAVTSLPIIVDADTGGDDLAFAYLCRRLEALGASGIIIEDKSGAKRTSLATSVRHDMADPLAFVARIAQAKAAMLSPDVMVFARIESLIAGLGLADALHRAEIYLAGAPDGIVIHSKDRSAKEIVEFMAGFQALQQRLAVRKPLVLVPTAYNHLTGTELHARGAAIIIHGNHMVRAAFGAMKQTAKMLLDHDRSLEADAVCAPVAELFDAVGVDMSPLIAHVMAGGNGAGHRHEH